MIAPNSRIIILKSAIELDELNQLTFTSATNQFNYFYSLNKIEEDNCTFQRKDNTLRFPTNEDFTYDDLLSYNYCMYQNTSYGDKWFYAFITKCTYINDGMSELTLKTDVYQTWQFDMLWKESFIEREHIAKSDDLLGANLVPENLETGEYVVNEIQNFSFLGNNPYADMCYIVASTSEPVAGLAKDTIAGSKIYNGIYTGCTYYRYDNAGAIDTILSMFANDGKTDAIVGIFMAPKTLAPLDDGGGTAQTLREVKQSNVPYTETIEVGYIDQLDNYTPHNKKLMCYPYNYLLVSNNIGQDSIYHWEKFRGTNDKAVFHLNGILNPGCSVHLLPWNYNAVNPLLNSYVDESITLGKFPICSFQNDMYTNWLTQNSINILGRTTTIDELNMTSSVVSGVIGALTSAGSNNMAGVGLSIAQGLQGVANSLMEQKRHNMITPNLNGKLNSADVVYASGLNCFYFYKMSVTQQFARKIDRFFDMYGYATNQLKLPNLNNRSNWNFVKTINANIVGNIPQNDLLELKQIFNNGVTLWHNPLYFLDYSQNNN